MGIDPEAPIEKAIARFFDIHEDQIRIEGRALILEAHDDEQFEWLCSQKDVATFWRGVYPNLAIALGSRIATFNLRLAFVDRGAA
jgi:hypothetical protein